MSSMVRWRWVMPSLSSRTIQSWCSRLCTRCDPLSHRLSAPSCFKENDSRVPVPVLFIIKFVRYLNNKECWRNGPSTWYKLSCVAACFWADTILFQTKKIILFSLRSYWYRHIFLRLYVKTLTWLYLSSVPWNSKNDNLFTYLQRWALAKIIVTTRQYREAKKLSLVANCQNIVACSALKASLWVGRRTGTYFGHWGK